MSKAIGMPSGSGIKESLIDYGLGAGGGVVYALSNALTGSGLLGGLLGAALAGSIIKGTSSAGSLSRNRQPHKALTRG